MRLRDEQRQLIVDTARRMLGADVKVSLFGSRVDDQAKGGDVDLYVEMPRTPGIWRQAQVMAQLEKVLGLPVDLLVRATDQAETPLHRIARLTGVALT